MTGWNSAIVRTLVPLLPVEEEVCRAEPDGANAAERHLFCAGLMRPKGIADQDATEIAETFMVNAGSVMQACDRIIEANDDARICVIGSESGYAWSFDGAYAAAKAALHRYVETKKLRTPEQQLVAIAPGIIADAGMTTRRNDKDQLLLRAARHPKKRFLQAVEVARLIRFCLYDDAGYLSGTVIRMNGGERRA